MSQQFSDVSSMYGAPMGRRDFVHFAEAVVTLFKVHMVDGDYDDGGAYWGGSGKPLYCARDDYGEVQTFVRAASWDAAKAALLEDYPDMKFLPREFDLDAMVENYLVCALWTSTDSGDRPLDANHDINDFSEEALAEARDDCQQFASLLAAEGIDWMPAMSESALGTDFWLTRNHHGSGFWDAGLGELGDQLTKWAESLGSCDVIVGDDGKLYLE